MQWAHLDNHPNPFFVISGVDKVLLWMNGAAENLLARSYKSMSGKPVDEINKGFKAISHHIEAGCRKETTIRGQGLIIHTPLGDVHICQYLLYRSGDDIIIMLTPDKDELNADSAASQSVTMLGRMLAHELKNPLAGIHGAAQLLEGSLSSAEDKELTDLIRSEAERIGRLADKMEAFGANDHEQHGALNIHTVLRKAKMVFQAQENLSCNIIEDYDPSLPDVFGNEDSLMQLVVNLIANAREAIIQAGQGGKIILQTAYRTGVARKLDNGESQKLPIELLVIDDGPGIAKDIQGRIFQPFVTGKANGQGLGLALVSKIVDDHNGIITLKSKPGKTVFSVLLPMRKGS